MKETTLTLTLKGNVKKAVFKNYKILKQEGYLLGAKWLKEEAYAVEGGKEYHVLLRKSNGTLGYLTIFAEQLTILKIKTEKRRTDCPPYFYSFITNAIISISSSVLFSMACH